jgi:CopG family transcriptional regulator/antitoxin EndoAI
MPKAGSSTTHRRVNITLPSDTLQQIERVAEKGDRSRFIARAVAYYIEGVGRANLRRQLREGAVKRAARDLEVAEAWFPLEDGEWQKPRR